MPTPHPLPRWLVKQEPDAYSFEAFLAEGRTDWTGVRNYQARNNLAAMQRGDLVCYYHSNIGLEIVGLAQVTRTAYPDPTATGPDADKWICVELVPYARLRRPLSLSELKADARTAGMALIKQSRLSVMPLTEGEGQAIVTMAGGLAPLGEPMQAMTAPEPAKRPKPKPVLAKAKAASPPQKTAKPNRKPSKRA